MTKGFYPGRVELYGLSEDNYRDYLPDYNYFMIHPINHHFKIWVNDKPADYEQVMCAPILSNEQARAFYENKGLYRYNGEKFYEMYLESQISNQ